MIDERQLQAARAVLNWGVRTRRLSYAEFNELIGDVWRRERMLQGCQGKAAFETFELANRIAGKTGRDGHKHRRVFRCSVCGKYHLATRGRGTRLKSLRVKAQRNGGFRHVA